MSICRSIQQAISVYSRNATRGTGVIARSTALIRASRATSLLSSNPYSSALNDNNNNRAASFSSSTYRPIVAATTSTATTPELQNDQRFPTEIEDRVQQILKKFAPPGGSPAPTVGALCDSHAEDPGRIALFYKEASGRRDKYTFREMMFLSSNFANVLRSLGVQKGDRVGILLPKTPELMIAALGLWRIGAAYVPLFTAFGPDAIEYRLSNSGAKVVITDSNNRPKLDSFSLTSGPSASVSIVTVTNNGSSVSAKPSTTTARTSGAREIDFWKELNASSAFEVVEPEPMSGDDLLSIIYTSGTTGNPKGVEIPVRALAAFQIYMEYAIHLEKGDMFWNLADPGWAYGLYYNLIGPLLLGKSTLFVNAPFAPQTIYETLHEYQVTNFAAAPTAYRSLRAAVSGANGGGNELEQLKQRYQFAVKKASSAGEPLNPEAIKFFESLWGVTIRDHYGQTELGMVCNNHHHPLLKRDVILGSMGSSMPGYRVVVLDDVGGEIKESGVRGVLSIDTHNSPLHWFRGYWKNETKTKERFVGERNRYNVTGDVVCQTDDNNLVFSGRDDDIISSAGFRIGPFEVESALMKHTAVAECAVVGVPDELRGERVKAFVVTRPGVVQDEKLQEELKQFVKQHLSAHEYPREIEFLDALPKTPGGKIQRYLLRKRGQQ